MTNQEKIDKINKFQSEDCVHPLTCSGGGGNCSNRESETKLQPIEQNGEVVLECPKCKRIQEWIPEIVYSVDIMIDEHKKLMKKLFNK